MKFIKDYKEGDRVFDIYLCKHKQSAVTKNGKPYETVILQDKTGTVDGKIWDPNSAGIDDFDSLDYIAVYGDVQTRSISNESACAARANTSLPTIFRSAKRTFP